MRRLFEFTVAAIAFLSLASVGLADGESALRTKVDALAQPIVDRGLSVGLVVGLIDGAHSYVFAYGKLSAGQNQPPDGDTLFEIGSVTKVFTGLLLADMVQRRRVQLDDPVQALLPDSVKVPQRDGRAITLLDLATHTSGLPRVPNNLHFLYLSLFKNPSNPYADYRVEHLYEFLSKHTLARKPGDAYAYSNLGMGLLGHALACRENAGYEDLLVQRICLPLKMNDTRIHLSADQQRRLAPGHDSSGKTVCNWDLPTLAGAGALRSTANDMLRFLSANLGLGENPLAETVEASHVPRHEIDKPGDHIALGWHIRSKEDIYWHNGQTGGYHAYVAFQKTRKVGVVALSNSAQGIVDELGVKLMAILAGEPNVPLKTNGD